MLFGCRALPRPTGGAFSGPLAVAGGRDKNKWKEPRRERKGERGEGRGRGSCTPTGILKSWRRTRIASNVERSIVKLHISTGSALSI